MIKAVLFDMDGLLIDTEKYLVKDWCAAAQHYGFDMRREHALHIRSLARKYAKPYLRQTFGEGFDYDKVRDMRRALVEQDIAKFGLERKAGAVELLTYLKKNGYKTAVATATDETRARDYLERVGLLPYFDRVVCATMVDSGKPAPDVYLYAAKCVGEAPQDCIALEDSPNGVRSAAAAGCHVIMVPDQTQPDDEISSLLTAKADSLLDVIGFIQDNSK